MLLSTPTPYLLALEKIDLVARINTHIHRANLKWNYVRKNKKQNKVFDTNVQEKESKTWLQ